MSYAAAVDHLYALGHELAPSLTPAATPAPRRKFDLAHMRTLMAALGDPQPPSPPSSSPEPTAKAPPPPRSPASSPPPATAPPSTPRRTSSASTSASRSTASRSPTKTSPASTSRSTTPPTASSPQAASPIIPASSKSSPPSPSSTSPSRKIDIAVLEVGLGGRLDATNIVDPLLSIITDIALDHQDYLGNTIAAITREKAGILRPNGILITLPQHPEANQAIGEAAATLNLTAISAAPFIPPPAPRLTTNPPAPSKLNDHVISTEAKRSGETRCISSEAPRQHPELLPSNHYTLTLDNEPLEVDSPLPGQHQQRNIALAIAAAVALRNLNSYNIHPNK